jgi:CheY-like chemotaxis protein/glycine cleavage system H lipoate-binding protein
MEQKKILVVDDEINVCKSIRQAILKEEFRIDTALSGEEAIQKDKDQNYDLIITDLMMPGISGIDLLRSLKTARPEINIIMITGYPTIKTAVQSVKMGAFDYIPKPFTPKELRSIVARAFKKSEVEDLDIEEVREIKMPAGLYYLLGHTWIRLEEDKKGIVGVVHDFLKTIGTITEIDLPHVNTSVSQGEKCASIKDADGFSYGIWSPATGLVIDVNQVILEDYSMLKQDPYQEGWLFRIETTDLEEDKKGLLLS